MCPVLLFMLSENMMSVAENYDYNVAMHFQFTVQEPRSLQIPFSPSQALYLKAVMVGL